MEKSKVIIQANTSCGREGGKKPGWVLLCECGVLSSDGSTCQG